MRRRVVTPLAAVVVLAAACSLPSDAEPRVIATDQVPEALEVPPDTAVEAEEIEPGEQLVTLYVFDEESDSLDALRVPLEDGSGEAAVEALLAGPERSEDQATHLPPTLELVNYNSLDDGLVMLELSEGLEEVEGATIAKAIAQLVFTIRDADPDARLLAIEVEGVRKELPDDKSEVYDAVWVEQYQSFVAGSAE